MGRGKSADKVLPLVQAVVKTPKTLRYESVDAFYQNDERRRRSGEMDFGVFWREGRDRINLYSLHVINDTCEVYIDTYDGHVELLGALPTTPEKAYSAAEMVFAGWTEAITNDDSLNWVRQRLAAVL